MSSGASAVRFAPHAFDSVPETPIILLVEDRDDDILLMRRALEKAGVNSPLHVVHTGEDAVAYLEGAGKYKNRADHPLPSLLLLDLKLPGMDGFELISWVRQQLHLRALPIVVLTSSTQLRDANRAYRLGANSFLIKDVDLTRNIELARVLHAYWLQKEITPENFPPPRDQTPW